MNDKSEVLKIALPSDGEMYQATLDFLKNSGMSVKRGSSRQYLGSLQGLENVTVLFTTHRALCPQPLKKCRNISDTRQQQNGARRAKPI